MKQLTFIIQGVAPLLMHNGRLSDPADYYAMKIKEISGKAKKTPADYEEMARLEFLGGLYTGEDDALIVPGFLFEACIIGKGGAARKERAGKQAAASVWVIDDAPLIYEGPRTPDELWQDKSFVHQGMVVVKGSRIKRTRPIFREWSAEIAVDFNEALLGEADLRRWLDVAGEQVGLMDWRPRLGRFVVIW